MTKAIIFDFDGTIADTAKVSLYCTNALSKKYGYEKISDFDSLRDMSMNQIIRKKLKISLFRLPNFVKDIKNQIGSNSHKIKLFKGMSGLLKKLSLDYDLYILTSNSSDVVESVLKKDIKYFKFILSDSSVFGKSAKIKKLLNLFKIEKKDVIYVGDELRDIVACKKAGIKVISVAWGYNSESSLRKANPGFVSKNYKEFNSLIKRYLN